MWILRLTYDAVEIARGIHADMHCLTSGFVLARKQSSTKSSFSLNWLDDRHSKHLLPDVIPNLACGTSTCCVHLYQPNRGLHCSWQIAISAILQLWQPCLLHAPTHTCSNLLPSSIYTFMSCHSFLYSSQHITKGRQTKISQLDSTHICMLGKTLSPCWQGWLQGLPVTCKRHTQCEQFPPADHAGSEHRFLCNTTPLKQMLGVEESSKKNAQRSLAPVVTRNMSLDTALDSCTWNTLIRLFLLQCM